MGGRFQNLKSRPEPEVSAPRFRPIAVEASADSPRSRMAPSREGKKAITGHFDPAMSKALQKLGLDQDRSLQDLMGEAFDDLLRKYGQHPVGGR